MVGQERTGGKETTQALGVGVGGREAHALGWVDELGRRVVQAELEARVGGGEVGAGSLCLFLL